MVKFKGRISFRQPTKSIKWGYKIWIRADQMAFLSQLQVSTGKNTTVERDLDSRAVKDFTRFFGRELPQNYFNNVQLQKHLLK